jgi:hypothetical protein
VYQRPGNQNFHVLDPQTEEERPLVSANDEQGAWMFSPRISPDGKKVAVFWNRPLPWHDPPATGLYVISIEDGSFVRLREERYSPLGWSADGQWVYAREKENKGPILRISLADGQARTVGTLDDGTVLSDEINTSPDGKRFVYTVGETRSDLWMVENFDPDVR